MKHINQERRSISILMKQWRLGKISRPHYQRGVVWSGRQQREFLASILNGYGHPPIWLVARPEGGVYVIDGLQRLSTIAAFCAGDVALNGTLVNGESLYGLRYDELPEDISSQFDDYSFTIFDFEGTPSEASEQFLILNQADALKPGEKLNALETSAFARCARSLAELPLVREMAQRRSKRMDEVLMAAQLMLVELGSVQFGGLYCLEQAAAYADWRGAKSVSRAITRKLTFLASALDLGEYLRGNRLWAYRVLNELQEGYSGRPDKVAFGDWFYGLQKAISINRFTDPPGMNAYLSHLDYSMKGANSSETLNLLVADACRTMGLWPVHEDRRRIFSDAQRRFIYYRAGGKCEECGCDLDFDEWYHADHVIAYSNGGPTDISNGQALCPPHNLAKSNK